MDKQDIISKLKAHGILENSGITSYLYAKEAIFADDIMDSKEYERVIWVIADYLRI